jgi:hypothetical protein
LATAFCNELQLMSSASAAIPIFCPIRTTPMDADANRNWRVELFGTLISREITFFLPREDIPRELLRDCQSRAAKVERQSLPDWLTRCYSPPTPDHRNITNS